MLIWAKMGYNIISNISRILRILYHIIYPTKRYYIRYRYAKTYIFPTTDFSYMYTQQFRPITPTGVELFLGTPDPHLGASIC